MFPIQDYVERAAQVALKSGMIRKHGAIIVSTRGPNKGIISEGYNEPFKFEPKRLDPECVLQL